MEEELLSQRAFLLGRMRADKQQRLTAAALKKLPKAATAALRLDGERIAAVLAGLVAEGFVSEKTVRKSVSWHLTEAGAGYLATLPLWPALSVSNGPPPPVIKPVHSDARLLARQQAYALFQLFIAKGGKLSAAQLRTKLVAARARALHFDAATVEWVLSLLVVDGSVIEHRRGKTVSWRPGETVPARLAKLEQHPEVELTLSGAAWNAVANHDGGAGASSQDEDGRRAGGDGLWRQPPPQPFLACRPRE